MTDDSTIDRRTVLRTTGAALTGSALAAGSASASHIPLGGCARAKVGTPIYENECGVGYTGDYFEQGDEAKLYDYCTDSTGYQWAYIEPVDSHKYDLFAFWVYEDDLEPC